MTHDVLFEKGLPVALDAERFILGSVMLNDELLAMVAAELDLEDFSLEKHRRIFSRMRDVANRGDRVDRVTLADELIVQGQLESVDGLSYLVSLDDGLPELSNIDSYVRLVKEKSILRKAIFAYQKAINECLAASDPSADILARSEAATRELSSLSGNVGFKSLDQVFHDGGGISEFVNPQPGTSRKCVPTPWPSLNALLTGGGLRPGTMTIIAARPSHGKTSLACNISAHAAAQGTVVAFFTVEMGNSEIMESVAFSRSAIDSARHSIGMCTQPEKDRLMAGYSEILDRDQFPFYLLDEGNTLNCLRSALIKLAARHTIGLIVVDYVQLMRPTGRSSGTRNDELTVISAGLKGLAKQFDAPIVVLAQLSRGVEKEDRKPMPSDLRDCGALESDADVIMMPYTLPRDKQPANWYVEPFVDLLVPKQRRGSTGYVPLRFKKQYTRFEECGR